MKKVLLILAVLVFATFMPLTAKGEQVSYPIHQFILKISGTTPTSWGLAGHSAVSKFSVNDDQDYLDLMDVNPALGVFTMSPVIIEGITNTTTGATYEIRYSVTNANPSDEAFANSGTTSIYGPVVYTGTTGKNLTFTPEFGRYYQFYILSGTSGFNRFDVNLLIQ